MIDRRLVWVLVGLMVLLGVAEEVQAGISLGSAQDGKYVAIEQGGDTSFRIFLFNVHQEDDLEVYLGAVEDGGLSVEIEPDYLTIPYTEPGRYTEPEEGYVFLGTGQGDVKAKPVRVRVSAPLYADPGRYEVIVYAATKRGEGLVGTAQVRKFFFTIDVGIEEGLGVEEEEVKTGAEEESQGDGEEEPQEPGDSEEGISLEGQERGDSITGAVTGVPVFGPIVLAGVLLLLLVLRLLKRI
jgi:hypothetical protein